MHQNSWFRNDAFVVMLAIPVVVGGIEDIATLSRQIFGWTNVE